MLAPMASFTAYAQANPVQRALRRFAGTAPGSWLFARVLGRIDRARVDDHRRVVGAYDLPTTLPPGSDPEELTALFARDKKAVTGVTFVLDGPDGVEPVTGIDPKAIDAAFEALR
jgi:5-deoxy-5-amino-3-dehydroquinate synthase